MCIFYAPAARAVVTLFSAMLTVPVILAVLCAALTGYGGFFLPNLVCHGRPRDGKKATKAVLPPVTAGGAIWWVLTTDPNLYVALVALLESVCVAYWSDTPLPESVPGHAFLNDPDARLFLILWGWLTAPLAVAIWVAAMHTALREDLKRRKRRTKTMMSTTPATAAAVYMAVATQPPCNEDTVSMDV